MPHHANVKVVDNLCHICVCVTSYICIYILCGGGGGGEGFFLTELNFKVMAQILFVLLFPFILLLVFSLGIFSYHFACMSNIAGSRQRVISVIKLNRLLLFSYYIIVVCHMLLLQQVAHHGLFIQKETFRDIHFVVLSFSSLCCCLKYKT